MIRRLKVSEAKQAVLEYAFNFVVNRAKVEIADAIDAKRYNEIGWFAMLETYDAVRTRLKDQAHESGFYHWSQSGVDFDRFNAAKYMLGEAFVNETISSMLRSVSTETLESLGAAKLAEKKKEAVKENVDDWQAVAYP